MPALSLSNIKRYNKGDFLKGLKNQTKKDDVIQLEGVDLEIAKYFEEIIQKLKDSLEKKGNNATEALSQSINPLPIKQTINGYEIELKYEDYGDVVDKGRKPSGFSKEKVGKLYMPIFRWVQIKPGLRDLADKKKKSFAYFTARKILIKGTKGSRWLTDVIGENGSKLEQELTQKLSSILGRGVEVTVTKQAQDMLNGNNSK